MLPGACIATLTVTENRSHAVSQQVNVASGEDPLFQSRWHLENAGQVGNGTSAAAPGGTVALGGRLMPRLGSWTVSGGLAEFSLQP